MRYKYRMEDDPTSTNGATLGMLKLAGQEVTIEHVGYQYKIVGSRWFWTDEMFAGLSYEVNEPDLEPNDMSLEELIFGEVEL